MIAVIIVWIVASTIFLCVHRICIAAERCDKDILEYEARKAKIALEEKRLMLADGDSS